MTDQPAPTPPPELPDFIFLLSDHESHELACNVAQRLYELDSTILVYDFLTPIHEGLATMRGIEWDVDLGALPADAPTRDELVSLEKWYNEQYGEEALGVAAYVEAQETRQTNAATIVYRDATWTHLKAFLPNLKSHQFLIVSFISVIDAKLLTIEQMPRLIYWTTTEPTVQGAIEAILESAQ